MALARTLGWLFAFGVVVGTAMDALHTHGGVTAYTHPWVFKMAVWTPFVFGGGSAIIGLLYPLAEKLAGRRPCPRPSAADLALAWVLFTLLYALSAYAPWSNPAKAAALVGGLALLLLRYAPTPLALGVALLVGTLGPALEAGVVATGELHHAHPDFFGIACWLPPLYAASSVAYGLLGQRLADGARSAPPTTRTPPRP